MVYIVTLIAVLVCVVVFDFGHYNKPRLKNICYTSLLVWLIAVSGFAYNVGSDIPGYMREYAAISRHHFNSWADLSYFDNRQPGWTILNIICSRIYDRFVLFQLVMAVFCNCVIFKFIKTHTKYIFLGVFLYFICSYLNLNFNSLRQTFAIAFFLIGYDYLVEKKWIKYYICIVGAFMFHSTAVICVLFPFLYILKINTKTISIFIITMISLTVLVLITRGVDMISDMILNYAEFAGYFTDREEIVEAYFGDNAMKYEGLNLFGIIQMIIFIIPVVFTVIAGGKHIINLQPIAVSLLLLYIVLFMLDFIIPVVFMRFVMYIDIIYYCALSDFAIDYPQKRISPRIAFTTIILCIALFRPVKTLFSVNPASDLVFYKQFYPYYSVFDPQIDPVRANNFDSYREN